MLSWHPPRADRVCNSLNDAYFRGSAFETAVVGGEAVRVQTTKRRKDNPADMELAILSHATAQPRGLAEMRSSTFPIENCFSVNIFDEASMWVDQATEEAKTIIELAGPLRKN